MVGIVVNVVPHHEFIEREQSEEGLFHDVPPGHVADGIADGADDSFHIDAALVGGQWVKRGQIDVELLFQQFKYGDVDDGFFVARPDKVVAVGFADDVDGHQDDGGKAGLLAAVVLVPFQHAQGHEQRVGAVLFECVP